MASTYTPNKALDLARRFATNVPTEGVAAELLDMVNSQIWTAYPWRWALAAITPISLTDGVQDYAGVPADFYRLVYPRIVRTDVTPNEFRELIPTSFLAPELTRKGGLEQLRYIAYEPVSNKFRLNLAASIPSGVVLQIQGEYQKVPVRITTAALDAAFLFPDHYFPVFLEGLRWKLYQLNDDSRAGGIVQSRDGRANYTGQYAVFMAALDEMRRAEDYGDAQAQYHPEEPIGVARSVDPGLFGY